jgi:hypothetical protein
VSARAHESLLLDVSAYARYLVAAPLFVLASAVYVPQLDASVQQLLRARLLCDRDRPRLLALMYSTQALLTSRWTEVALVAFAYVATLTLSPMVYQTGVTTWVAPSKAGWRQVSIAGWWCTLVSQPIFMGFVGAWLWRVLLWARMLSHLAWMDLQLVASHPDRLGGLRFLLIPLRGFTLLAFAIGAVGAGGAAEGLIFDGRSFGDYRYAIAVQAITVLVLFAGPFLLLMKPIVALQARGTLLYGRLATELGHEFEGRWSGGRRTIDQDALGVQDFSATTDLYSVAANVREINPFVLDVRMILALAIATLLPYLPLVFVVMPLDEVVRLAVKALT